MKPKSYTSEAVVLNKKNLGEADKIITVFSKDFGKLSLVAKGIRKPKSRKRGHLEIFSLIKFQGIRGKNLDIITEVEVINDYKSIRQNLKKITLAYYFCEVVIKITNEGESNLGMFNLISGSIKRLSLENNFKLQRLNFIHNLLVLTGFHPANEKMINHDKVLINVIERNLNSERIGKRMLQ